MHTVGTLLAGLGEFAAVGAALAFLLAAASIAL